MRPRRFSMTDNAWNSWRRGWNSLHHRPVKLTNSVACTGIGTDADSRTSEYGVSPTFVSSIATTTVSASVTTSSILSSSPATSSARWNRARSSMISGSPTVWNTGAHAEPSGRLPTNPGRPRKPVPFSVRIPMGAAASNVAWATGRASARGSKPSMAAPMCTMDGMERAEIEHDRGRAPTQRDDRSQGLVLREVGLSPCSRRACDRR